jgi:hypothetical protein
MQVAMAMTVQVFERKNLPIKAGYNELNDSHLMGRLL